MQEIILKNFEMVAGQTSAAEVPDLLATILAPLPDALVETSQEISALRGATQAQTEVVSGNTDAVWQNTYAQSSGVKSAVSNVGRSLSSWWSLMPVAGVVKSLLSDREDEAPPALPRYSPPPPLRLEAQRIATAPANVRLEEQRMAAPQITVQVQAMDSRSFMEHSGEIARAVRDAMLNMHALNDVVNDL